MKYTIQSVWDRWSDSKKLRTRLDAKVYCDFSVRPVKAFTGSVLLQRSEAHVHLEDDIVLDEDFETIIEEETDKHPNALTSFSGDYHPGWHDPDTPIDTKCLYIPDWFPLEYVDWAIDNKWHPEKDKQWGDISSSVCEFLRYKNLEWLQGPILVHHENGPSMKEALIDTKPEIYHDDTARKKLSFRENRRMNVFKRRFY